ncbi:MAG: LLM class flavin-dependent oxidoreductase, partial [Dehalococcoidia bacterium]
TVQKPRPPITVGASGPRMLRLAAEYADAVNTSAGAGAGRAAAATPSEAVGTARRRNEQLDGYCAERGRDPATITRSLLAGGGAGPEDPWVSVDAFQDFVGRYRDAGVNEFLFYYPSRMELAHGTFERIAGEVIPTLKSATAA